MKLSLMSFMSIFSIRWPSGDGFSEVYGKAKSVWMALKFSRRRRRVQPHYYFASRPPWHQTMPKFGLKDGCDISHTISLSKPRRRVSALSPKRALPGEKNPKCVYVVLTSALFFKQAKKGYNLCTTLKISKLQACELRVQAQSAAVE